jgi:hypothetical protein
VLSVITVSFGYGKNLCLQRHVFLFWYGANDWRLSVFKACLSKNLRDCRNSRRATGSLHPEPQPAYLMLRMQVQYGEMGEVRPLAYRHFGDMYISPL